MKSILKKCQIEDLEYISEILDNYAAFTDDSRRKELLIKAKKNLNDRGELIELVDKQIRYFGSADLAYLVRSLYSHDGGVSSSELVADVCAKLKIKIKLVGTLESRLEKLAVQVVEKELFSKTPEQLSEAFKDMGVGTIDSEKITEHLKRNGKVAVIPVLFRILGPELALGIIEGIVVSIIAKVIGTEAAKALIKAFIEKNPWVNALGPWMWGLSAAWLAFDVQGPAYRKTVPICLYLGVVGLRDGPETPITDLAETTD